MQRVSYIRFLLLFASFDWRRCGRPEGVSPGGRVGASQFEIGAFRHETRTESQTSLELPNTNEFPPKTETVSPPPPTRSSFMATWPSVRGAKGYLLDASTSSSFDTFVDGYHDLEVGTSPGE